MRNVLIGLVLLGCTGKVDAQSVRLSIDTVAGPMEFIQVQSGEVQVGREIGLLETLGRLRDPKRLNESGARIQTVKNSFFLARDKLTVKQYTKFLNDNGAAETSEFLTPAWRQFLQYEHGEFIIKQTSASVPCVFVSLVGADAFVDWLAAISDLPIRLPTEAEWLLASVGPHGQPSMDIKQVPDTIIPDSPRTLSENGFEGLISAVGEWQKDPNDDGDRLLKRAIHSPYEREYKSPIRKSYDESRIYGIRLLLDARLCSNRGSDKIEREPSQ